MKRHKNKYIGIIGWGSIAKKHFSEINTIDPHLNFIVLTRQNTDVKFNEKINFTNNINEFLEYKFEVIIVATPASEHADYVSMLIDNCRHLIIEKPIAASVEHANLICSLDKEQKIKIGYNLRYLNGLKVFIDHLNEGQLGQVFFAQFTVGQCLTTWRPDRDFRLSVSAQYEKGGGVLRELSHELDLATFIFGPPRQSALLKGNIKFKKLDVEDTAIITCSFIKNGFPLMANFNLDFIRTDPKRQILIVGDKATLMWDILTGKIKLSKDNNEETIFDCPEDLSGTYKRLWLDILNLKQSKLPNSSCGKDTICWIEEMEKNALIMREI